MIDESENKSTEARLRDLFDLAAIEIEPSTKLESTIADLGEPATSQTTVRATPIDSTPTRRRIVVSTLAAAAAVAFIAFAGARLTSPGIVSADDPASEAKPSDSTRQAEPADFDQLTTAYMGEIDKCLTNNSFDPDNLPQATPYNLYALDEGIVPDHSRFLETLFGDFADDAIGGCVSEISDYIDREWFDEYDVDGLSSEDPEYYDTNDVTDFGSYAKANAAFAIKRNPEIIQQAAIHVAWTSVQDRTIDEYYFLTSLNETEALTVGDTRLIEPLDVLCSVDPLEQMVDGTFWEMADSNIINPSTQLPTGWTEVDDRLALKVELISEEKLLVTAYDSGVTVEYQRTDTKPACP